MPPLLTSLVAHQIINEVYMIQQSLKVMKPIWENLVAQPAPTNQMYKANWEWEE